MEILRLLFHFCYQRVKIRKYALIKSLISLTVRCRVRLCVGEVEVRARARARELPI